MIAYRNCENIKRVLSQLYFEGLPAEPVEKSEHNELDPAPTVKSDVSIQNYNLEKGEEKDLKFFENIKMKGLGVQRSFTGRLPC